MLFEQLLKPDCYNPQTIYVTWAQLVDFKPVAFLLIIEISRFTQWWITHSHVLNQEKPITFYIAKNITYCTISLHFLDAIVTVLFIFNRWATFCDNMVNWNRSLTRWKIFNVWIKFEDDCNSWNSPAHEQNCIKFSRLILKKNTNVVLINNSFNY